MQVISRPAKGLGKFAKPGPLWAFYILAATMWPCICVFIFHFAAKSQVVKHQIAGYRYLLKRHALEFNSGSSWGRKSGLAQVPRFVSLIGLLCWRDHPKSPAACICTVLTGPSSASFASFFSAFGLQLRRAIFLTSQVQCRMGRRPKKPIEPDWSSGPRP